MKKTTPLFCILVSFSALLVSGCDLVDVVQGVQKVKKYQDARNMEFSEVDEYYIGRQILATFLAKRDPLFDRKLTDYLNSVGQTLAAVSQRPDIWAGYRFIVYHSPYMGAYSLPGGFMLISTGMLRRCENEDQLAAVLGHELGHARWRHPLEALKEKMVTRSKQEMIGFFASRSGNNLVKIFAVAGIINWENQLNRYSRTQELEADVYSCWMMMKAGYNPYQMIRILKKIPGGQSAYSKYHPSVTRRLRAVRKEISRYQWISPFKKARQRRYVRRVLNYLDELQTREHDRDNRKDNGGRDQGRDNGSHIDRDNDVDDDEG